MIKVIKGNLFEEYKKGYDLVAHGTNLFCVQASGIAPLMHKEFGTRDFPLEDESLKGNSSKLGTIDYKEVFGITVINAYTQTYPGPHAKLYAVESCFKKINETFPNKKLLIPAIGCGIGGLNLLDVLRVIINVTPDLDITMVIL